MTDVLKGELGVKGFLVSDWKAIEQLPGSFASQVEASINAGMDMVMAVETYPAFFGGPKALVQSGKVPMSGTIGRSSARRLVRGGPLGLRPGPRTAALLALRGGESERNPREEGSKFAFRVARRGAS